MFLEKLLHKQYQEIRSHVRLMKQLEFINTVGGLIRSEILIKTQSVPSVFGLKNKISRDLQ